MEVTVSLTKILRLATLLNSLRLICFICYTKTFACNEYLRKFMRKLRDFMLGVRDFFLSNNENIGSCCNALIYTSPNKNIEIFKDLSLNWLYIIKNRGQMKIQKRPRFFLLMSKFPCLDYKFFMIIFLHSSSISNHCERFSFRI